MNQVNYTIKEVRKYEIIRSCSSGNSGSIEHLGIFDDFLKAHAAADFMFWGDLSKGNEVSMKKEII